MPPEGTKASPPSGYIERHCHGPELSNVNVIVEAICYTRAGARYPQWLKPVDQVSAIDLATDSGDLQGH